MRSVSLQRAKALRMLICHCNVISEREIEEIVLTMLREEPWQLIVPAMVYRAFETQGRCCGCATNLVDIIARVTENYHLQQARTPGELIDIKVRLAAMRKRKGGGRERRSTGHRAA